MSFFEGKTVMITGGTGSFGGELVTDLFKAEKNISIKIYSRDEKKQEDMLHKFSDSRLEFIIGDIRDYYSLEKALVGVDFVFHASALKQISTGERFPEEVIKTNVMGILNLISASEKVGVKKIVNLSSDKATFPVNAYGNTKALSEKIVRAHVGNTACVNLRYGNVMGSRNSVIPLFIQQMKDDFPITVTNFKMTRFMLPLKEACFLSVLCAEKGNHGDLFVIKSPACSIGTLTDAISEGLQRSYSIVNVGIRPGEKIHETLLTNEEVARGITETLNGITYVRVPSSSPCPVDYSDYISFTSENKVRLNQEEVLKLLRENNIL
jgi:UDP-glucose 4-epimerase